MSPSDLRAFEEDIASEYDGAKIRSPVHLDHGNEEVMIEIFGHVKEQDWLCCSWRSHYACLLKGVPPAELKDEIMAGRSISLCFQNQRIVSSAIVGGILPIAVGLGMAEKRLGSDVTVWVFAGDMTAATGIFRECFSYVTNWALPVRFIVADNRKSVCTDTRAVWNSNGVDPLRLQDHIYEYDSKWPHAGAGKRIQF